MLAFTKPGFWSAARERDVVLRALKIAAVVGTILVAINHGDAIIAGGAVTWWKVILTFMVPYGVATYAAAAHMVAK